MVGSVPSAIGPSSWSLSASATSLMAAACSSTRDAMATIFSPSGVGRIFCLPRSNSTPSSSSSFLTAMRQRRLAHVAALGGAAEMLLLGEGDDVAELGEGHGTGIFTPTAAAVQFSPPNNGSSTCRLERSQDFTGLVE